MANVSKSTNFLVKASLLAVIAAILMIFEFPVIPAFDWLKIDFSDIPALIGAFAYGPLAGVIIEGVKIVLRFFFKGTQTGGIGELANFIIGASFMIPAGFVYARSKTRKTAILGMALATVVMSIAGVLANYFLLIPLYKNFLPLLKETSYVTKYMIYGVIPFNLIKGAAVSLITLVVYKKISVLITSESLKYNKEKQPKGNL